MRRMNLYTWTRITRLNLAHLSVGIGNAALEELSNWPKTGEGRLVKSESEKINRLLEFTHDKTDIIYQIEHLEKIVGIFQEISDNTFFKKHIAGKKYHDRLGGKTSFRSAVSDAISSFHEFSKANKPKRRKITVEIQNPKAPNDPRFIEFNSEDVDKLQEITPKQKSAPLQFQFQDGVLKIKQQSATGNSSEDRENIGYARAALESDANDLMHVLLESNCDPRLIKTVEDIHKTISSSSDVIKLGLIRFTCDSLFTRYSDEIPDIASARFLSLTTGLGMYVAQFPEWQRFVENAAELPVAENDLQEVYRIGQSLLPNLRDAKDLVDPEVPRSLLLILEALQNPKLSSKRALFGAIRSLENLLATIFSEFAKLVGSVSEGARSGIKAGTSALIASSLLIMAATWASQLSPIAERTIKARWMKQAAELVQKALD